MYENYDALLEAILKNEFADRIFAFLLLPTVILVMTVCALRTKLPKRSDRIWFGGILAVLLLLSVCLTVDTVRFRSAVRSDVESDAYVIFEGTFTFTGATQTNPHHTVRFDGEDGKAVELTLIHNDALKDEYPLLGAFRTLNDGPYRGRLVYAEKSGILIDLTISE